MKEWLADLSAGTWIHRRVDICLQMDTEMKRSGIEVTDGRRSVDEMTV